MTATFKAGILLAMEHDPTPKPFIYYGTTKPSQPFVFAVPHSGQFYPPDFVQKSNLAIKELCLSEDAFVDRLFEDISNTGADMLVATHARSYLDLNRAENELDATMFTPNLPHSAVKNSHRVQAGLGAIPSIIAEGMPIYNAPLPAREAEKRIQTIHQPYHAKLATLLKQKIAKHQTVFLLDCHSMPSSNNKSSSRRSKKADVDIILGDCWGSACSPDFTSLAEELLFDAGFTVRRNVPYSGGYSTSHYGSPANSVHALQIEINRALYMDETSHTPLPEFSAVRSALSKFYVNLINRTTDRLSTIAKMQQLNAAE